MLDAASIGQVALVSAEDSPVTSLRVATLIARKKSKTRSVWSDLSAMYAYEQRISSLSVYLINRPSDLYNNSDEWLSLADTY